jgi:putative peptide zinc metalloprotease protein
LIFCWLKQRKFINFFKTDGKALRLYKVVFHSEPPPKDSGSNYPPMNVLMAKYTSEILVAVYPFTRQIEGEEVVIGRTDIAVFLALPYDAVEILDNLSEGNTVGETQLLYQEKYGEVPDLEELLELLEHKGFVQPLVKDKTNQSKTFIKTTDLPRPPKLATAHFHFANFPQSLAQRLFSRPVLFSCCVLIGLALVAIAVEPSIIPGWGAHFFHENFTLMRFVLIVMSYATLFLHEMAHVVAARAVGVSCRMGISNRMWMLVAETDLTGIWGVPRNKRYLPFLAGPLLDAVSASVLTLILFAQSRGWFVLHPVVFQLVRAMLLTYLLGLLWQCYFFVRTDFYFVIANFFRCKSLMKDTEVFLRNYLARFIPSVHRVNQSHIPVAERWVIRCYAILWLVGRIAALGSLIFIIVPLIWHYYLAVFGVLSRGYQSNSYAFIDALLMILLVFTPQSIGFWLWIRSFYTAHK